MADSLSSPVHGYQSRDIFIDTSVFRRAGMNLDQRLFRALREICSSYGMRLHVPEIVLRECGRRILEYAVEAEKTGMAHVKALRQWGFLAGDAGKIAIPPVPDAGWIAMEASFAFESRLRGEFGIVEHPFEEIDTRAVMESYFAGRAPFGGGKAEFPDAMIASVAAATARKLGAPVYLIAEDGSLLAAAADAPGVLPVRGLDKFLEIGAGLGPAGGGSVDLVALIHKLLDENALDDEVVEAFADRLNEPEYVYDGTDVGDVEIEDVRLGSSICTSGIAPIYYDPKRLSYVMDVQADLELDASFSFIDHVEDDRDLGPPAFGASGKVRLKQYGGRFRAVVDIDLERLEVTGCEILTRVLRIDASITRELAYEE